MGRIWTRLLVAGTSYPGIVTWFVVGSMLLAAQFRPWAPADAFPPRTTAPLIAYPRLLYPGLYLLGGLSPAAAYAVETSKGLVLVDAGLESDASLLKSQLQLLQFDLKEIRAVLITHAHLDHCGGAEYIRVTSGAKIYAGQGDAGVLKAGGPHEAFFSAFALPGGQLHPTQIDVELKGGELIDFGDVTIRALATPGHTPGSICYLMQQDGHRVLFTGDVISMLLGDERSHVRIAKPLGTYSAYLPPRFRGDARTYLESLRTLRAMPVPDLVLPGHPRADPTPQDPGLTQERWEEILDGGIAEMTTLVARYEADGADFLDGAPIRLLPDLYYLGDFRGAAVYGFFASSEFFLVDAPGGPGLLPFIKVRLQQLGLKAVEPAAVLLTSCDPGATAGLQDLLLSCHPRVIVATAGQRRITESCPAGTHIVAAEESPWRGGLEVTPIPLRGRGEAPIAYRIRWAGKTVLFSGRIPIKLKVQTDASLFADISKSRNTTLDYLFSVFRLGETKPDLWLPAVPVDSQNANLYDTEWQDILADNYRIGYRSLERRR
jgi:glyoxylase-like metal-dependent hydrolase (beta-lactamase superfamily II)